MSDSNQAKRSSLPQLTAEQRADALVKAAEARTLRAARLAAFKRGELTPEEALSDPVLARCKVSRFLRSAPHIGERKATAAMERIGIAENRRVGGLGPRQRADLLAFLDERGA